MNSNAFGMIKISDRFYISIFSFFALLFFFLSQGFVFSLLFITSAAIHEANHIFFLYRYKAKINGITVFPFGIDINSDTSRLSYKKELVCTLAGCISNLLLAFTGCILLHFFPSPPLLFFVMCNLFLGTLNLIPLSFFDGGKALRLILYDSLEIDRAFYIHKSLDVLSALIFLSFSVFIITGSDFNISVCAVIVYAAISTLACPIHKKTP